MIPGQFFPQCGCGVSKFLLPGKNYAPLSDKEVWNSFQNPNYIVLEGSKMLKMLKRKYFWWFITFSDIFVSKTWGFHILAVRKNNFCHPRGNFWLILGLKIVIFEQFSTKFNFFSFLRFPYTSKQYRSSYKCFKRNSA